jgi:hypothetical protein
VSEKAVPNIWNTTKFGEALSDIIKHFLGQEIDVGGSDQRWAAGRKETTGKEHPTTTALKTSL